MKSRQLPPDTKVDAPAREPLTVSGTMLTHVGLVREANEDIVAYVVLDISPGTLALVADGMGGHAAGEVASRIAADIVMQQYFQGAGAPPDRLGACFDAANLAIRERARIDPECAGMGTTCTALAIQENRAFLAHIGDSRAYIWRAGTLSQITDDHSLVAQLVKEGTMTQDAADRSPDRNIILRALGTDQRCEPTIWREGLPLQKGDVFLLCSDGLSDLVDRKEIAGAVSRLPPFDACHALIDMALAAGGTDNVSVGVFAVGDGSRLIKVTTTRPIPEPGLRP